MTALKLARQMNENVYEWMCRLWIAVAECNNKKINRQNRQLKAQFMHRLNDNLMLAEIIRELTKTGENKIMTGE